MDISKVERQAPAEQSRTGPPPYTRILLQDILCLCILLSLALIIVAGILCVADDVTRIQHRQRDPISGQQKVSTEVVPKQMHRYFLPHTWIRLFGCKKLHQPQQNGNLEQLQKPERDQEHKSEWDQEQGQRKLLILEEQNKEQPTGTHLAHRYKPINHSEDARQEAAGDHVVADPAKPKPSHEHY